MARILACGAFLKNAACLLDTHVPGAVHWSGVHGDLADPGACVALEQSVQTMLAQAGTGVDAVAHDLHPDFFSTHLALRLAQQLGVPAIAVQHHHAHIASVLAEHCLDVPVIGLALDGVGLGHDGVAWGGEVLAVRGDVCDRVGYLHPLALAGGDVAAREPWRMAAAALYTCGHVTDIVPRLGQVVGEQAARTIQTMLTRGLNCPATTAAGRWFDAAAGLLGLSVRQEVEAQAAMALEQAAARHLQAHGHLSPLDFVVDNRHWSVDGPVIDLRPLLLSWLNVDLDVKSGETVDAAAARFHCTLADALAAHAVHTAHQRSVDLVVLGGGCFFNRILKARIVARLNAAGLRVLDAQTVSCGDAGLALGQAWVAARRLQSQVAQTCLGATVEQEQTVCV